MPRFLIVAGILLTAVAVFDPFTDVEDIAFEAAFEMPDEAIVSVPKAAVRQAYLQENEPTVYAATRLAPAAAIAAADVHAEEALVSPSQTLSSASLDISREETDPSIVLLSPFEMTRAVQTELRRLSCYEAKIDGVWGSQSRAAVRLFNKRSNSSFHLNESVELLTALKDAPAGLCDASCSGAGSCEIVASAEDKTETPVQTASADEKQEAPSYLPPWMRGEKLAAVTDDGNTEVSETYTSTHTSVSQRVYVKPRPSRRTVYRSARRKKNWLPESWPGVD